MYIGMNYGWFTREGMNHAVFLNIGAMPYLDLTDIPSKASVRSNLTPCMDNHVPDQYGLGVHKGFSIRIRTSSFKFIERHNNQLSAIL